jgi:hypothetical protein
MATQVVLTFSDGKLVIPPEVQEQMHPTEGAQLRAILTENEVPVPKELPEWKWEPNNDWRSARGMLSDHPEHDARKFGWSHKP